MQVETALFFETVEQIYARVFRSFTSRTPLPRIAVRFRPYANANSRIRLENEQLNVDISDVLEGAPAPIQDALAHILIAKLFRKAPDDAVVARYRRYLYRSDIRRILHLVRQQRGRKLFRDSAGQTYDLCAIFDELNVRYFHGLMARPQLGWSLKPSRTTLGHYDPSHNVIVLSSVLDSERAPELVVRFVLFHEMLHLRYPTQHRTGRRSVHTPEFKQAERQFENYREAKCQLKRLAERAVCA